MDINAASHRFRNGICDVVVARCHNLDLVVFSEVIKLIVKVQVVRVVWNQKVK